MTKRWTLQDALDKQQAGNITIPELKQDEKGAGKAKDGKDTGSGEKLRETRRETRGTGIPAKTQGQENKDWIYQTLKTWCQERGFLLIREHTFSEERSWRLDWAVFDGTRKVAGFEYNGIFSKKSRHTTAKGYTGDMEKLNAAQSEGWIVYQYTAVNFKQLENDLIKIETVA